MRYALLILAMLAFQGWMDAPLVLQVIQSLTFWRLVVICGLDPDDPEIAATRLAEAAEGGAS